MSRVRGQFLDEEVKKDVRENVEKKLSNEEII